MSLPSAGRQPPSFKTNVNRAKTKRWVEAKSYSYDGDDWGEVDDYDEYGGYDEPQPPSRPTGLRQQGQSATQAAPGAYTNQPDVYQSPIDSRQQGYRNLSGPASAQPQYGEHRDLHRSDSFNRGDERRAFSAGGPQQGTAGQGDRPSYPPQIPQAQSHATRFSQIEGINQSHPIPSSSGDYPPGPHHPNQPAQSQPGPARQPIQVQSRLSMDEQSPNSDQAYSPGGSYRGVSYSEQPRHTSIGSRAQSMTSNVSSQDFHNRRDFTPSAVPPPLQTRGSPSPQSASDSQSSARHPPRKDSLSQHGLTNPPYLSQLTPMPAKTDREDDAPLMRERAGSNTSKPLPLVRPADIYKRMQDEKEKERQSQESFRPSIDLIMGHEATPVSINSDRSNIDSLGRGPLRRNSFEALNDEDSNQRLKPTLDPVKERKSEYGFEGFSVNDRATGSPELPATSASHETVTLARQFGQRSTTKPILPDVTRMSGFGESFLDTISPETSQSVETEDSTTRLSPQTPRPGGPKTDLQHQPSVGFRSIVNQAFDTPEDQIPPTPSSTADSTFGRSASGGTSVVSPIDVSRMPSAAAPNGDARDSNVRPVTPNIPEMQSGNESSNLLLSGSLGTPRQRARKASLSQNSRPSSIKSKAAPFKPGHRRDLSTPSPDNSPAKTPALDSTQHLRQPQEAELAMVTPVESNFPTNIKSQNAEAMVNREPDLTTSSGRREIGTEPAKQRSSVTDPPSLPPDVSRRSRPDSPGTNRVRDLAGKFESGSSSPHGSERSLNHRRNVPAAIAQKDATTESRPITDRMESFRPCLPGGWDSFASNAPSAAPKRQETLPESEQGERGLVPNMSDKSNANSLAPAAAQNTLSGDRNGTPKPDDQNIPKSKESDVLSDPFSAVAAAGTALAGALAVAVGMESTSSDSKSPPPSDYSQDVPKNFQTRVQPSSVVADAELHPNAWKPLPPIEDDDQMSSVAPTPLSRDTLQTLNEKVETLDYFPPIVPLKPRQGSYINADTDVAAHPRPPMPPSLSTDTGSQFESDRLRREIVRKLDPAQSSEPTTAESKSPWQDESRLSANPSLIRQGHESGVLPSEYDSYWNGSSSASSSRTNSARDHIGAAVAVQRHDGAALVGTSPPLNVSNDHRTQPTDISESQNVSERPARPHRYSWEQSRDNGAGAIEQKPLEIVTSQALADIPSPLGHHNLGSPTELSSGLENKDDTFSHSKALAEGLQIASRGSPALSTEAPRPSTSEVTDVRQVFDTAPDAAFGGPTGEVTEIAHLSSHLEGLEVPEPGSRQQQDDTLVTQYSDQADHMEPSIPQDGHMQMLGPPSHFNTSTSARESDLPPLPPPSDPPKLRAFREILALKSPMERIQGFNETREQFAHVNTGLAHWLDTKTRELPEHAHLLSNQGLFATGALGHKASPSRNKILGIRAAGSPSTQQPYYQQYLNASSQPTASDGSLISSYQGSTLLQGFSPSGGGTGKLSSQQVQTKGKDLLHTAGVFGGKANVAAKGLFSKGRSRFKNSNNTDKVDK